MRVGDSSDGILRRAIGSCANGYERMSSRCVICYRCIGKVEGTE
jgi:hypothetical protein